MTFDPGTELSPHLDARPDTAAHAAAAHGKVRVLLVDDHSVMRQGMRAIINEESDMAVCGEADGVRSAIAEAERTAPDVAVIDLSIRDGDGLELLREMKRRFPRILAIVLSMFDESVYADRAIKAGARGYVMKEQAAKTVIAGIREILHGGVYVSEAVAGRLARSAAAAAAAAPRRASSAPHRSIPGRLESLSDRELQVLRAIGQGLSARDIGEELFISVKTVEAHREHIKQKLGLVSSGELLRYAIEHNRLQG